ncbi:MAG: hypothetical protein QXR26_07820 [Candidatus Caldarchaeum sp.]
MLRLGGGLEYPIIYKNLFHYHYKANDGREVRIALWLEDATPHFSSFQLMEHEEPLFIPSGHQPNYDKGESYCSKCCQTFINRDKCPNCNKVLRKKPRRKKK